jgi:hypothetical protein
MSTHKGQTHRSVLEEINMEIATYSQVQELVRQLPAKKLLIAYDFLFDLVNKKKRKRRYRLNLSSCSAQFTNGINS